MPGSGRGRFSIGSRPAACTACTAASTPLATARRPRRAFHALEDAVERDREKDAQLTAAGYRVVRITWRRLAMRPAAEAARLSVLLGLIPGAPFSEPPCRPA
jgi:hypothetical protein